MDRGITKLSPRATGQLLELRRLIEEAARGLPARQTCDSQRRQRMADDPGDAARADAEIEDTVPHQAVVSDVPGLSQKGRVLIRRDHRATQVMRQQSALGNEVKMTCMDRRTARVEAATGEETDRGRKGSPTDVSSSPPPGDPGRGPPGAGDPKPLALRAIEPSPVVKGRPSPRLFSLPAPALVGFDPVALGVRPPAFRDSRRPDVAEGLPPLPVAVIREGAMEALDSFRIGIGCFEIIRHRVRRDSRIRLLHARAASRAAEQRDQQQQAGRFQETTSLSIRLYCRRPQGKAIPHSSLTTGK